MMKFKVEGWCKYYSPATFTALVKDGLITRSKTHKDSKGPYIYINMKQPKKTKNI